MISAYPKKQKFLALFFKKNILPFYVYIK